MAKNNPTNDEIATRLMQKNGPISGTELRRILVDLYGRFGSIEGAQSTCNHVRHKLGLPPINEKLSRSLLSSYAKRREEKHLQSMQVQMVVRLATFFMAIADGSITAEGIINGERKTSGIIRKKRTARVVEAGGAGTRP